ncbi:MAG: hypothetical protein IIX36_05705 [Clostridia bacterium]|nr:hypothetical protein [Clostridia bacterium]
MKNKKFAIIGAAVVFVLGLAVAALIAMSFTGAFATVPKPEIKEGEFDFSLTCEIDGETKKLEGTYVCKFEGVSRALDGVGRDWKGYIKDHGDSASYELKTTDEGTIKVDLDICSEFFMSDPNYQNMKSSDDPKPEPYVYITSGDSSVEDPANGITFNLYEGDDVKIISFEYDQPIENTYK